MPFYQKPFPGNRMDFALHLGTIQHHVTDQEIGVACNSPGTAAAHSAPVAVATGRPSSTLGTWLNTHVPGPQHLATTLSGSYYVGLFDKSRALGRKDRPQAANCSSQRGVQLEEAGLQTKRPGPRATCTGQESTWLSTTGCR